MPSFDDKLTNIGGFPQNDDKEDDIIIDNITGVETINLGDGFESYIGFNTDNDGLVDIIGKRFTDNNINYADLMDAEGDDYTDILVNSLNVSEDLEEAINNILGLFTSNESLSDNSIKKLISVINKINDNSPQGKNICINNAPTVAVVSSNLLTDKEKTTLEGALTKLVREAPILASLIIRSINGKQLFNLITVKLTS